MTLDPTKPTLSNPRVTPTRPLQTGLTREERARALGHCVLRTEDVTKIFHRGIWPRRRRVEVLKGASSMVCKGEIVGLVGEVG